jgi:6-pyruvoyltetrahydropterin/6-carboxytetrahydropterin synthase
MMSITRRYPFSASHRLHSPGLSPDENARIYGKCNNPFGHGHDYILEVTVTGQVDPCTGLVVPIRRLDQLVDGQILQRIAYRNLNADVSYFASQVPTTENIALVIARVLTQSWKDFFPETPAYLRRIHIQETGRNSFEVVLPFAQGHTSKQQVSA